MQISVPKLNIFNKLPTTIYAITHATETPINTHGTLLVVVFEESFILSNSLFPNKTSTFTSNNSANLIKLSELGLELLLSHYVTACRLTPMYSATFSCDNPFSFLNLVIFSPN